MQTPEKPKVKLADEPEGSFRKMRGQCVDALRRLNDAGEKDVMRLRRIHRILFKE